MCKAMEDMRNESLQEGIKEGRRESMKVAAERMLADGTLALEKIAEYVGLSLEEVKKLKAMGCHKGMVSMQGLGYKELLAYLNNEITLEEAVYILKRDTRHFAKRQLTWFGREKDVVWLNKDQFSYDEDAILTEMLAILREKGILP